ncbi:restriction endonuclease subunit S [Streptomyces sp. NPDC020965]|uniref:restriction endonuclease subunit S n=1 Tax=Streptomyces sp. NPDC020965 TaxID=3365105 RepID=UPI00379F89D9
MRAISQAANQNGGLDWSRTRFHDFNGDATKLKGHLRPEDILINSTGTGTLGRVGFFSGAPDGLPCMADGHVTIARTKSDELHARFAYYWLGSQPFQEYMYAALAVGATNQIELNRENLGDAPIPVPPMEEQRRIADFLDSETTHIDQLAIRRGKQSSLLDEHSRAAAYSAITGAKEVGPRRASGIQWIHSLPSSWKTMPVNYQFEVMLGKMLNQERTKGDYLRPYLRNVNVQWDRIDTDDLLAMDFPPSEQQRYKVLPGDLLICEGGEPGRAAIWDGHGEIYYQKALHRVRPRGYSSSRWLYYCLLASTALNVFAVEGNSTTITHLTGEQLKARRFPFPDRPIQDRFVAELDKLDRHQRELSLGMAHQAKLLAERRQALITAAVTGQIDVSTASGRGIEE